MQHDKSHVVLDALYYEPHLLNLDIYPEISSGVLWVRFHRTHNTPFNQFDGTTGHLFRLR